MPNRRQRVATYRVQLSPTKGFVDVVGDLERLTRLGISHLYLSPVTEAIPGGAHGYDVVDHTKVRAELGGLDGLGSLLDAAGSRGLGVVIDHVPNHVSVAEPQLNAPWWTMLGDGPESPAARWFDVDWASGGGKVVLPVLGEPLKRLLAGNAFTIDRSGLEPTLRLGEQQWPVAAGTESLPLGEMLERQHYRLSHWRAPERNVRRFFTIDELVAVRVEHAEVAYAVDTVPRLLAEHAAFDGVRVDHVDGLADPGDYLGGLRDLIGPDRWLVVEKILAPGETLPPAWPVDGTTGYEHIRAVEHAVVDAGGVDALWRRWQLAIGDDRPFAAWEIDARREVLAGGLAPDLRRTVMAAAAAGLGDGATEAVTELTVRLGRYRTYLPADPSGVEALDEAHAAARAARPDLAGTLATLVGLLTSPAGEPAVDILRTRWQQLTGPATAKGVEDRAFFRYVPVPSLCEVGGVPSVDDVLDRDAITDLHRHHESTARHWPATLLAGTTHDTKRSEDVRARGVAICERADDWNVAFDRFWRHHGSRIAGIDPSTAWLALHTAATATPSLERLSAFLVKSSREAALHTSWTDPDNVYEQALVPLAEAAVRALGEPGPLSDLAAKIAARGHQWSIANLAVRLTAPGVPDVYQGTEALRFLLVDPDNRAEPDRAELDEIVDRAGSLDLAEALGEPGATCARAVVLGRLLALRRHLPEPFGPSGGYAPLTTTGGAGQTIAFARTDASGTARVVTIASAAHAEVVLPSGTWRHVLVDGLPPVEGSLAPTSLPCAVLTPEQGRG